MFNNSPIQWYPGHMAKADRQITEKLKLIDTVVEILDARVPIASKNPQIDKYCHNKKHLVLLNKADLSDDIQNKKWLKYFQLKNNYDDVMLYNIYDKKNIEKLVNLVKKHNIKEKNTQRCLICGIPNVGKSSIINTLVGKKKTQIGNKPGVTKGQQWLNTPYQLMLLDTPGILWPKFEDSKVGLHLAWIGSIKDTIFEKQNIAGDLLKFLLEFYPGYVAKVYKINEIDNLKAHEILDMIAKNRGLLLKGGAYDYLRASEMLLNDFKNGKVGRITIDRV